MQQTPNPPDAPTPPTSTAPILAPSQVTIDGATITTAQAIYQGFRTQRRELSNQLERLQDERSEISASLQSTTINEVDKKGLEQRLASVDERIASVDKQLMEADAQVARSAAIPGAALDLPEPPGGGGNDDGFYVVSTIFVFAVLMPMALAYSRRIWRRSAKVITTFPKELSDRLIRVEQAVESTALEVERIGEGQRFMTRLFTEGPAAQQLGQGARAPAKSQGSQEL